MSAMPYDSSRHHRRSTRLRGYDYASPGAYFVTICTHDRACLFGEVVDGQVRLNRFGRMAYSQWVALFRRFGHLRRDAFVIMPNHMHGLLVIKPKATATGARKPPARQDRRDGGGEAPAASGTIAPASSHVAGRGESAGSGMVAPVPSYVVGRGEASARAGANVPVPPQAVGATAGARTDDASPLPAVPAPPMRPDGTQPGSLGAMVQHYKSRVTRQINRYRKTPGEVVWQRGYWDRIVRTEREWHAVRRYIEHNPARWAEDKHNPDS